MLVNLIVNIQDSLKSILYLFTKYPSNFNVNSNLISLKNSLEETDLDFEKDSGFMTVIDDLIEKTEDQTFIIDPIKGDPKKILRTLKKMEGIKFPDEAFKYALSSESHNAIKSQVHRDQININCALKHQDCELILFYLKNLRTLKDLIEKEFLKQAYNDALKVVIENLQKFCKDKKAKFNRALHSQDGLKKEHIQKYKKAIQYIKDSQIFSEHLGSQKIEPSLFIQNIDAELQKVKEKIKDQPISSPLSGVYLDNLFAISSSLDYFKALYIQDCNEVVKIVESLFQDIIGHIKTSNCEKLSEKYINFDLFSEKLLILYNSSKVFKSHDFSNEIKRKYIKSIESLLSHLREFSKDPILDKQKITVKDVRILNENLEYLRLAKENSVLQDSVTLYYTLKNKNAETSKNFNDLSSIFNEFIKKITNYFENIYNKIQVLFKKKGTVALTDVQALILDMDNIRQISEIEFLTSKKYYETIEKLRGHAQDLQNSAEQLLNNFDPNSQSTKWGEVIRTLQNLEKNVE